jgi:ABC-2 type transport system ATP-binding protein
MSGSADTAAAAELRGAVVRFGKVEALRGVDLALERGRLTVLLGPNGAGKTTAIRLLLGLLRPTEGDARIFGEDPRRRGARRRIGAMMQVAKVPDTLRVVEHIDTFRSYYPAPLSRAQLIEAAGLGGLERRLFGTLSGGEKQRVLFALALAGDPDLLFLDEPTVGMDVETRRSFRRRIRALRDDGRAVLLTTHYLEEADALADRVIVLNGGRIIADGPPERIKREFARRRVRCATSIPLETVRSLADVDSAERAGTATTIVTAQAESVVRTLLHMDATLADLEVTGAALEDAFLALTRAPLEGVA